MSSLYRKQMQKWASWKGRTLLCSRYALQLCVCGARIDQYWIQGRMEEKERRGSFWGALHKGTGPVGEGEGTSVAGCGHLCLFPCCAESGCSHN